MVKQYKKLSSSHLAIVSALEKFRIFSPADSFSTEKAVSEFLNNGGPTYIRLGKHEKNLAEISAFTNLGEHVRIFGSGPNIIATHGSL